MVAYDVSFTRLPSRFDVFFVFTVVHPGRYTMYDVRSRACSERVTDNYIFVFARVTPFSSINLYNLVKMFSISLSQSEHT